LTPLPLSFALRRWRRASSFLRVVDLADSFGHTKIDQPRHAIHPDQHILRGDIAVH
jgi:hypothetical protein